MTHSHPFPTSETGVTIHKHSIANNGETSEKTADAPGTDRALTSISVAFTDGHYPSDSRDLEMVINVGVEQTYVTNPEPGEIAFPPNLKHWADNETVKTVVRSNTDEPVELQLTMNWAEIEI